MDFIKPLMLNLGQLEASRSPQTRLIGPDAILPESVGVTDQSRFKEMASEYTFGGPDLTHGFRFRSVYEHRDRHGELEVTTCTRSTKRTVDYIFYHSNDDDDDQKDKTEHSPDEETKKNTSKQQRKRLSSEPSANKNKLELIARLQLFTKNLVPDYSIPDRNYPSDHFILAAKFILT